MKDPKAVTSAVVVGIGALLVGVAYILPWLNLGLGLAINGAQISAGAGYLYLLPIAALLGLGWAVYVSMKGSVTTGIASAGVLVAVLALVPIVIMFLQIQSGAASQSGTDFGAALGAITGALMQALSFGFWGTILGAVVMLIGALMSFGARQADMVGGMVFQQTVVSAQTQVSPPPPVSIPPTRTVAPPPTPLTNNYVSSAPIAKTQPLGVPQTSAAWLVMQGGSRHGQQFGLKRGDNNVGRDGNRSDIVIDDSSISGQHARVRYENGQFWLYDLASTNGTFINNSRVQKQILYDNDHIRFGEMNLVFKMVDRRQ